jgi:hypothetical protein
MPQSVASSVYSTTSRQSMSSVQTTSTALYSQMTAAAVAEPTKYQKMWKSNIFEMPEKQKVSRSYKKDAAVMKSKLYGISEKKQKYETSYTTMVFQSKD